ncbi:MAG: type II secretion system protein [Sulfuricurvum sp.]|nr:type II secretion system protein [Sulfuricurvum sp.]MDD3598096.1 type II secretion system protein [Sulfuricurvum sp.]
MIELIFVIVVLGILAAIAIPKFAATRDDAQVAKGRSDVAAIRAAIVSERQVRLLKGESAYISSLDASVSPDMAGMTLFDNNGTAGNGLLQYGIATAEGNGHWMKTNANQYSYTIMGNPVAFTYTQASGTFDCNHDEAACKLLTE